MSIEDRMHQARELIRAKRYEEARGILVRINHPTATKWVEKIDSILDNPFENYTPRPKAKNDDKAKTDHKKKSAKFGLHWTYFVVLGIVMFAFNFWRAYENNQPPEDVVFAHQDFAFTYPDSWKSIPMPDCEERVDIQCLIRLRPDNDDNILVGLVHYALETPMTSQELEEEKRPSYIEDFSATITRIMDMEIDGHSVRIRDATYFAEDCTNVIRQVYFVDELDVYQFTISTPCPPFFDEYHDEFVAMYLSGHFIDVPPAEDTGSDL